MAIPASYYFRSDRDDERFAWRMFSAVRVRSCDVSLHEQRQGESHEADLEKLLHASWRAALARGRRRVMERLLEKRCREGALDSVSLVRSCREVDRERIPEQRLTLACQSGQYRAEGMPP